MIEFQGKNFFKCLQMLQKVWEKDFIDKYDSIIIVNGKTTENKNERTVGVVSWLFGGFNLTEIILFITKKSLTILGSQRKIKFLDSIKKSQNFKNHNISFCEKQQKNYDNFSKIWEQLHPQIQKAKVGIFIKDEKKGALADQFQNFIAEKNPTISDCFCLFNECLIPKRKDELDEIRKSSITSVYFMKKMIAQIENALDQNRKIRHNQLVTSIQKLGSSQGQLKRCISKAVKENSKLSDFDKNYIDIGLISVQSGGTYSLNLFKEADNQFLKQDCIILGFGSLYRCYNSYLTRTLLINPNEELKIVYSKVDELMKLIQSSLKHGVQICQIYRKASNFMKQNLPQIEIPKNFGFGSGIFLVDEMLQISNKNQRIIQNGYSFVVVCSFPNLKLKTKQGSYGIRVADTVIVQKDSENLTSSVDLSLNNISYQLQDPEPKEPSKKSKVKSERKQLLSIDSQITPNRPTTRRGKKHESTVQKMKLQNLRNEHQAQLKIKKLKQLRERINENFLDAFSKEKIVQCEKLIAYKSKENLPSYNQKIIVDDGNNSIILPINGRYMPFRIQVIKNVARSVQGKVSSLRFNFHTGSNANIVFPKITQPTLMIKQLVIRSQNEARHMELQKVIKALQKKVKSSLSQKNTNQNIVDQQALRVNKGKRPLLRDLFVRPLPGGKKNKGILQCHLNGFRFLSNKNESVDIIFSNIRYAFIQPCEKQIIAAVHFRLRDPILIGKKKTEDVQFYSECGVIVEQIQGRRHNFNEEEDDEEKKKQARRKFDRQIAHWAKSCEQYKDKNFQFQFPDRSKGFFGSTGASFIQFQPTKHCLINIISNQFFVLPLEDVEVISLQRIYSNGRSFDIVAIMKDYETFSKINQVPSQDLEKVKDFFNEKNIIFYEQGRNLNWSKFLGRVRANFRKFVQDKGWMAWDQVDEEVEEMDVDNDESFNVEDSQLDQSSSEDQESGYGEQDGDEDESNSSQEEQLSQSGLSYDQLQERAEIQDRERDRRQMEKKREKNVLPKKRK